MGAIVIQAISQLQTCGVAQKNCYANLPHYHGPHSDPNPPPHNTKHINPTSHKPIEHNILSSPKTRDWSSSMAFIKYSSTVYFSMHHTLVQQVQCLGICTGVPQRKLGSALGGVGLRTGCWQLLADLMNRCVVVHKMKLGKKSFWSSANTCITTKPQHKKGLHQEPHCKVVSWVTIEVKISWRGWGYLCKVSENSMETPMHRCSK